jgi:hypothetical protein
LGSTEPKGTRRFAFRKLADVPPFVGASEAETRDAYRTSLERTAALCMAFVERLNKRSADGTWACETDSPEWHKIVARVERIEVAATVDGWAGARRARMLLIAAIDDAVNHGARVQAHRPEWDLVYPAYVSNKQPWTPDEYAAARTVAIEVRTLSESVDFERHLGQSADTAPELFAAYLFRVRCPHYARALLTEPAWGALLGAIESWGRGRGRPRTTEKRSMSKWDACDVLMKEVGLHGSTAATLEADWREWNRRKAAKG